jgi:DNA repair exonuclease SbcCD ATPase subunit
MPTLTIDSYTLIEQCKPEQLPELIRDIANRLEGCVRTQEEAEEMHRLRTEVRDLKTDNASLRRSNEEWRDDYAKLQAQHAALSDRVNELLRAGAPKPELSEGERTLIRNNEMIKAIKSLRERIEKEHGYSLGLKEAKDLCDVFKATLPQ